MTRFRKHKTGAYRYLINGEKEWRLYRYTPRKNEFESGLKYRLCEVWYCSEWGEYRTIERCKVSSIKEAETLIGRWS